jgi:hypothetical protein
VVPVEYQAAAARYRRVVNGRAVDIRKRLVSHNLIDRDDPWPGMVVVKADLNFGGVPEWRVEHPGEPVEAAPKHLLRYEIWRSVAEVPDDVWADPRLVVERFLPERSERGFHLRTWVFLGDRGRCKRARSAEPLIKSWKIIDVDPDYLTIPDEIQAERERLGIDFGKFDYVLHEGRPVLFDANKTPGFAPSRGNRMYKELALALDTLLA